MRAAMKETFMIHIISQENSTWQGQVTWLNRSETRCFRSMLELIKLMDETLHSDEEESKCERRGGEKH